MFFIQHSLLGLQAKHSWASSGRTDTWLLVLNQSRVNDPENKSQRREGLAKGEKVMGRGVDRKTVCMKI